ncbi:N-acyl homoserine lactonase family protein [Microbacterium sp.]|uniref:N-acyl homoserine lactonase family protein n=1 Tax=Microbacterium sp. TaxID=51671 RepID=UPI003A8F7386
MTCYSIAAVRHGVLRTTRARFYLNYDVTGAPDGEILVGYWFWLIRGGERLVLVDTGFSAAGAAKRGREVVIPVDHAFRSLGLRPDDEIDVVLTHAHYDHAGNVGWFRRAQVWVSAAEMRFWHDDASRHAQFRSVIDDMDLAAIERIADEGRLHLITGSADIADGIHALEIPGHTPGQLAVRVSTAIGMVLLASDAVHTQEELDRDMPFRHNTDLVGLYRGLATMRAWLAEGTVAAVVPGHEAAVLGRYPRLPGVLAEVACLIG